MCTDGFSFNNSTFCLLSVFMDFEWIWGQTENISLYNINGLFYITDISPSKSQCHCMFRFNIIQHFYVLQIQRIYGFYLDLRTKSDYFHIKHKLMLFITEILQNKFQWSLNEPKDYHSKFLRSAPWLYFLFVVEPITNVEYFPIQH
jgi:hypothetical protein